MHHKDNHCIYAGSLIMKKAILALADGTVFEGTALGFAGETVW